MYGKLRYLLQEFALASDVSQRKRLLEQLHGELGLQMRQVLLAWRVPHLDHEDVVQDRVLDVARALLQQRVADDRLDAFVYACSANAARSYFQRRRQPLPVDPFDLQRQEGAVDDPGERLRDAEEREEQQQLFADALASPDMPPTYRRAIEHVRAGRPIGELAEALLREQPLDDHGVERTLAAARNQADAHLSRARKWLKARVAELRMRKGN